MMHPLLRTSTPHSFSQGGDPAIAPQIDWCAVHTGDFARRPAHLALLMFWRQFADE